MTAAEATKLRREHEAMAHTLSCAEGLVTPEVMARLRRTYIDAVQAAKERGQ